jgi:hypothetical protein
MRYRLFVSFEMNTEISKHPAFAGLSLGAYGLWVRAGVWSSVNATDGIVPTRALVELGDRGIEPLVNELVSADIWLPTSEGYRMAFGPGSDFPQSVWRYGQEPASKLFEIVPD